LHAGTCAISSSVPDEATLRSYCNMGYAGRGCANFPPTAECDAIRYSLASDCHGMLRIQFIHEKDHNPLTHGVTIYDTAAGTLTNLDGCAAIQARAFAQAYLRRRARA
jgi:hypothetical protein